MMINSPTSGNFQVTISGLNFGFKDVSPTVLIASASIGCLTLAWASTTTLLCAIDTRGFGRDKGVRAIASRVIGSTLPLFTFDAPVLSDTFAAANTPVSGQLSFSTLSALTLAGSNFATLPNPTPTTSIGSTICHTTSWHSTTAVLCTIRKRTTSVPTFDMVMTVGTVVGCHVDGFSFDAPVLSLIQPYNTPGTGDNQRYDLTLVGLNFDPTDLTVTSQLRNTDIAFDQMLLSTTWMTSTSLRARLHLPTQYSHGMIHSALTIANTLGTGGRLFTFNAPVLSENKPINFVLSKGSVVTISGAAFGAADFSATFRINDYVCSSTTWTSSTEVKCATPYAYDTGGFVGKRSPFITIAKLIGTRVLTLTFDSPVVSVSDPKNALATGGTWVTISGLNFASRDTTPSSEIVHQSCHTTTWTSLSTVSCVVRYGDGWFRVASATIGMFIGTLHLQFTFDAPIISQISAPNSGTRCAPRHIHYSSCSTLIRNL